MSFTFTVSAADWGRIAPLIVLAATALLVMLADLFIPQPAKNQKVGTRVGVPLVGTRPPPASPDTMSFSFLALPFLSVLGLLGAFAATIVLLVVGDYPPAFNSMIGADEGTLFAYIIILSASFLGIPWFFRRLREGRWGQANRKARMRPSGISPARTGSLCRRRRPLTRRSFWR